MQTAIKRVPRRAPMPAAPKAKAYEPPSLLGVFTKINRTNSGPSEWSLYTYLCGIGAIKGTNPFRTTVSQLRQDWEFEGARVQKLRLAINTVKSSLELLEDYGLVEVTRTKSGVEVYLDITIL